MKKFKNNIADCMIKLKLAEKEYCSETEKKEILQYLKENNSLPEGINEEFDQYYRWAKADIPQEDINNYLAYKKILCLIAIKNAMIAIAILLGAAFTLILILMKN